MERVKIRKGSPVFQDFQFPRWEDEDVIFDNVVYIGDGKCRLTTFGYGQHGGETGCYGNGAVFTKVKYLIYLDREQQFESNFRINIKKRINRRKNARARATNRRCKDCAPASG